MFGLRDLLLHATRIAKRVATLSLTYAIVARISAQSVPAQDAAVCDTRTGESAEEVFRKAQNRWSSNVYPYDLHYVLTISATDDRGESIVRHYDGQAEPGRDVIWMHTRSQEEAAQPPTTPHGINFVIAIQGRVVHNFTPKAVGFDIMGIPRLSPAYTFGMARGAALSTPSPAATGLKTIAAVEARAREYRVSCIDSALGDGGVALDHLRLEPLRDPNRNRIREVWIESGSYWTDRMLLARNFVDGPPLHSPWDIAFVHDDDAEYIARERALKPLDYGRGRVYADVTLTFRRSNPPPSAVSAFIFDGQAPDDNALVEP